MRNSGGERLQAVEYTRGVAAFMVMWFHFTYLLPDGVLRATFHIDGTPHVVTLQKEGDYVVFGPDVVHSWEALDDTVVLSVRFPSIEVGRAPELAEGR